MAEFLENTILFPSSIEEFLDFAVELDREWRATNKRYSDTELLRIFPEAKRGIFGKLREWEEKKDDLLDEIRTELIKARKEAEDEKIYLVKKIFITILREQEFENIDKNISRLKRLLYLIKNHNKRPKAGITQEDIERAKTMPIKAIIGQICEVKRAGRLFKVLCPFHKEQNASFMVYPESNSFYCFGCGVGGDTIDFVKRYYNLDFLSAVKFLINN